MATKNLKSTTAFFFCIALIGAVGLWFSSRPMKAEELKNADLWLTDFPKAQAQAKAEHKNILLDFTGSDWCPPCNVLRKEVYNTQEFADYARTNLVLVLVDFPQVKELPVAQVEANAALLKKYAVEGYPTTLVVDPDGNILVNIKGYTGQKVKEFLPLLKVKGLTAMPPPAEPAPAKETNAPVK